MKIYEIGTGYTPIPAKMGAATEIVVEALTKAMLRQGADVEIIDIASGSRPDTVLPIREVKVPRCFSGTDVALGILHKLKRVVYSVALAGHLRKLLKQAQEPVVLHFHNQYNLFFFLKLTPKGLRRRCRTVYTNHSGIWRLPWETVEPTIRKRYFQEAVCMQQADAVLVLNEETRQKAVRHLGIPAHRIHRVANGVDTQTYYPLPKARKEAVRQRLGLEHCRMILQVGSVNENKGQLRTLEYLLPLLKEDPSVIFGYAGGVVDARYQAQIQALAAEQAVENQVRYFGMIAPGEELNALYNAAWATVMVSRFESFGMVAIESCSAGVPVLVKKDGAVDFGPGFIKFTHEAAPRIFAETVSMEEERYDDLCRQARENVRAHYTWERIAQTHAAIYSELMVQEPKTFKASIS